MFRLLAVSVLSLFCLAPAIAADYAIDPDHTFVTFGVVHNGASTTRGRFDTIDGSLKYDAAARTGQADIRIDMKSIDSGSDGFDEHLRNEDFFNVSAYPDARFRSTAFVFDGERLAAVQGRLTLLGKEGDVELAADHFTCYHNKRIGKDVCGGDFSTRIQRSRWGMGFGLPGIPDSVHLTIQIEGVKQ